MMYTQPRVKVNDYSSLSVPKIGEWAPRLRVSVVIPAFGNQDKLNLALASLAEQTYPSELTEVIVVDDGSDPPLAVPSIRPAETRFIPSAPGGWGSGHAVNTGVSAATGDVILRLDADIVACREHIEAHMRWHHAVDYAIVLGTLTFAAFEPGCLEPEQVRDHVARSAPEDLFAGGPPPEPSWVESIYAKSVDLRTAGSRAFQAADGATISFSRRLFDLAGGMDANLPRGSDTEFGYRAAQRGAIFVPDRQAKCWHLGLSEMKTDRIGGRRLRTPYVAQRVPLLQELRKGTALRYRVPLVDVIIETAGCSFEDVAASALSALNSYLTDVRVTLVGSWPQAAPPRGASSDSSVQDQILLLETFRHDDRVRFADQTPEDVFPTPFALHCPPGLTLAPGALRRLLDFIEQRRLGVLMLPVFRAGSLATPRLTRTAALARARHLCGPTEDVEDVIHGLFGVHWIDGAEWALIDVSEPEESGGQPDGIRTRKSLEEALARAEERARKWKREAQMPMSARIKRGLRRRIARYLHLRQP